MSIFSSIASIENHIAHLAAVQALISAAEKVAPIIEAHPELLAAVSPQLGEAVKVISVVAPDVKGVIAGVEAFKAATPTTPVTTV
jgi:hypothetical protein